MPKIDIHHTVCSTGFAAFLAASLVHTAHAQPCAEPLSNPIPIMPPIGITVRLDAVQCGLPADRTPTDIATLPDGSGNMLVGTIGGEVFLLTPSGEFTLFLDTRNSNTQVNLNQYGLTSVSVHPGFADPESPGFRKFYTITTENKDARPFQYGVPLNHLDILSEWEVDADDPLIADPSTEREVLVIAQRLNSHNMTDTLFLDDGTMLISLGDSGNTSPGVFSVPILSQQLSSIFGKIIRIDPLGIQGTPGPGNYSIPDDNPFASNPSALKEIYALGVRSPYKLTTDPLTGDIYSGDVGQESIESINLIQPGLNYGWPFREGSFQFDKQTHQICFPDPPDPAYTPPVTEYGRKDGRSVSGGPVYRGSDIPELDNHLLFGDFTGPIVGQGNTGRLFAFNLDTQSLGFITIDTACGEPLPELLFAVERGSDGEIYILGRNLAGTNGCIYKMRSATPLIDPADINEDGIVDTVDLGLLLGSFGAIGTDDPADINGDGVVDTEDLGMLLGSFGNTAGPC